MVNIFDRKHNFIKINKKNHYQNKVIIISVKKIKQFSCINYIKSKILNFI